jgi:DNA polymerase-4
VTAHIKKQCHSVAKTLRSKNLRAKGVRLKIRYSQGFQTQTAQTKLPEGVQDSTSLANAVIGLFSRFNLDRPIRLVGVTAFDLHSADRENQLGLFVQNEARVKREKTEQLSDAIEKRFGDVIVKEE